MKRLLLLLGCSFFALASHAQITIGIIDPIAYKLVGNILTIQARVSSMYQLSSVHAEVSGRQTPLTYNVATVAFEGSISLSGLTQGDTLSLVITAADVLSNAQTASRLFIYDEPPALFVDSPLNSSVARPYTPVSIRWHDTDSCFIRILWGPGPGIDTVLLAAGQYKDSLTTILNLGKYHGNKANLYFYVIDKRNQKTLHSVPIYVDTSAILKEYAVSDVDVLDFNYNKIFTAPVSGLSYPAIVQVLTHQKTILPLKTEIRSVVHLTPTGAIFGGVDSSKYPAAPAYSWGYDWNGGTTDSLGKLNSSFSLTTAGGYAIWSNGTNLYFRNLMTRTTTLLSSSAGNISNSVAANGLVAYWDDSYNINTYRNGTTTKLTDNANNKWNTYPATDGNYIVYRKHDACCSNYTIRLLTGNKDTLLSDFGSTEPEAGTDYQVNNKFVAYSHLGPSAEKQVFVRDTAGNNTQRTFFGNDSKLELLNNQGDVTYTHENKRFLSLSTGQNKEINSALGKAYYRDSNWYVAIGRVLFKVDVPALLPLKLISFTAVVKNNTHVLTWSTTLETNTAYTIVDHSTDGSTFLPVGKIYTHNVSGESYYSFTYEKPDAGLNYYRLRFVDKDGSQTYSPIKALENKISFKITALPNPVGNRLYVRLQNTGRNTVYIRIVDTNGTLYSVTSCDVAAGSSQKNIDVSNLAPGVYVVEVSTAKEKQAFQFEKL